MEKVLFIKHAVTGKAENTSFAKSLLNQPCAGCPKLNLRPSSPSSEPRIIRRVQLIRAMDRVS